LDDEALENLKTRERLMVGICAKLFSCEKYSASPHAALRTNAYDKQQGLMGIK